MQIVLNKKSLEVVYSGSEDECAQFIIDFGRCKGIAFRMNNQLKVLKDSFNPKTPVIGSQLEMLEREKKNNEDLIASFRETPAVRNHLIQRNKELKEIIESIKPTLPQEHEIISIYKKSFSALENYICENLDFFLKNEVKDYKIITIPERTSYHLNISLKGE